MTKILSPWSEYVSFQSFGGCSDSFLRCECSYQSRQWTLCLRGQSHCQWSHSNCHWCIPFFLHSTICSSLNAWDNVRVAILKSGFIYCQCVSCFNDWEYHIFHRGFGSYPKLVGIYVVKLVSQNGLYFRIYSIHTTCRKDLFPKMKRRIIWKHTIPTTCQKIKSRLFWWKRWQKKWG